MAKSHHPNEIIEFETDNSGPKPAGNRRRDKVETRKLSPGHAFLDELALWKRALQIETFVTNHSNQK